MNFSRINALWRSGRTIAALVLAFTLIVPAHALAGNFVVVGTVTKENTTLRHSQLKKLLLGKRRSWPDGTSAVLVLPPAGSPEMSFLCELIGTSEADYRGSVLEAFFRGILAKPIKATSAADIMTTLAKTPGGLSVVSASAVSGPVRRINTK